MPSLKQQQARDWAYSRVSGLEDPRPDLYNDGSNVPTIGVGYALVVKGRNGWSVKEELVADFRSIGAPLSAASIKTLNGIADAKNKGQQAIAKSLINDLSHVSIEKEQIQPLYNRSFDRHYMRTGQILENKNFDQLPAEQQGVLTIVTFQSPRALKNEKGAIISGIQNKDPAQVVGAFKRIGKMFKEPGRYNGLAHNFLDPDQKYTIDVRQGDYLGKIAQRYNTTVDALMNVNTHIENKDEIRAGDVLVLPAGAKKNGHFVYDAQSAYKVLGVNHTLEGGNYIGPSHELSPQDAMTADQSKAWVEKMQAVRNAKKSNLLSEAISSNPFKQTASTTFGNDSLQVASLGNDAFVSMPSNTASPKTVDVRYGDTLSGLAVQHGTTVDAFMRANPQIKDADKIQAGARLNRPSKNVSVANVQTAIQGFMNTPVYRDQRQPAAFETVQNAFASLNQRQNQEKAQRAAAMKQAEKQKADDEKVRQGAYQRIEVNRQATIAAQQKGDRALDAGRAKEEQAKEKQQAKQLAREEQGMPELDGVHEIGVAKIDQLGENAISKAMPKDDLGQRRGLSPENIAAAVRKRNALAPNQTKNLLAERSQGMGHSPLTSTPKTENYSGPGSIGGYDAKGSYQTGHNKNGSPTGGSKLDKHDREIGAYGQFTRDVVGRGDGSAAAGNTRVICTELVRRGLMDAKLQRLDAVFTIARLSNTTVRGYHVLAVPYVRLMKRSNLATHMIEPIARWRAEDVAYKMDARPRPNLKGRLVRIILEPICWLVGRVVEILPGDETRFHPFSQMKR